ncbi:MAG: hypothetical protein ABIN61_01355 [candidate division WOR-3 bacterium]
MRKLFKNLLLIFLLALSLRAIDFVSRSSIDLNGDNEIENIILININDVGEFYLEISGQKIKGKFSNEESPDGFKIVDINTNDKYKEIAVHSPGPSDDDEYFIYWYDGKSIKEMAHLSRWPEFPGNGIVYVKNWEGFWTKIDKYILNNSLRKLELVPQFAYYVGVKATVKKSFPIFRDKDLKEEVAWLTNNSEIEILLCDTKNREWDNYIFLIKSALGLVGWAHYKEVIENLDGLPLAD